MDAPWAYIKARLFEDWIIREIPLKNSTPKRIIALACPYLSLWLFHITLAQDVPRFLSLDTISFWRIDCLIITSWIQDKFLEFSMLIKLPNYLLYCIWWGIAVLPKISTPIQLHNYYLWEKLGHSRCSLNSKKVMNGWENSRPYIEQERQLPQTGGKATSLPESRQWVFLIRSLWK